MGFKCGIVGLPNVGKSTPSTQRTKTAAKRRTIRSARLNPMSAKWRCPSRASPATCRNRLVKEIIPTRDELCRHRRSRARRPKGEGPATSSSPTSASDAIAYVLRCFENDDITTSKAASIRSRISKPSKPN